jgi:hypothetical protein
MRVTERTQTARSRGNIDLFFKPYPNRTNRVIDNFSCLCSNNTRAWREEISLPNLLKIVWSKERTQ